MYERYLNHQRDKAEFITYVFHDLLRVHFRVKTSSAFARSRYGACNVPAVLANQRRLRRGDAVDDVNNPVIEFDVHGADEPAINSPGQALRPLRRHPDFNPPFRFKRLGIDGDFVPFQSHD